MTTSLPLCVDMDDTLVHGDVLYRGMLRLLREKFWLMPWFLFWLLLRRAAAKAWLAKSWPVDAASLPYRVELLDYLKAQKTAGRRIYLVSAADERQVKIVANYVGLFDAAYGSDGKNNLKGVAKANFIRAHIAADFVYAGDSFADLKVWNVAKGAILCGKAASFKNNMAIPVEAVFD